jgi:hypothetical protein
MKDITSAILLTHRNGVWSASLVPFPTSCTASKSNALTGVDDGPDLCLTGKAVRYRPQMESATEMLAYLKRIIDDVVAEDARTRLDTEGT